MESNTLYRNLAQIFDKWVPNFVPADERLWREWVCHRPRTKYDLLRLAAQPVPLFFRVRAAIAALVPSEQRLPFFWRSSMPPERGRDMLSFQEFQDLKKLSGLFAEVTIAVMYALEHNDTAPVCPSDRADAILDRCNLNIITLLEGLEADDPLAQALFERFSVTHRYTPDVELFAIMGHTAVVSYALVYNPFRCLLTSDAPLLWKERADYRMHTIVLEELIGARAPRMPWESAYDCYIGSITAPYEWMRQDEDEDDDEENMPQPEMSLGAGLICRTPTTGELSLLGSQIRFVLDILESPALGASLDVADAMLVCAVLPDEDQYMDVRRRFADLLTGGSKIIHNGIMQEEYDGFVYDLIECLEKSGDEQRVAALRLLLSVQEADVAVVSQRYRWDRIKDEQFYAKMRERRAV